ncbi:NUDIX domain-containing protein [Candidatus Bathycorpusculum sp.]|uniref:bis(5'-nucleosyl)-tetraphosphatase n=1 Tax=Candidatus Bathycorpusculum sp. TaxID=2994959 RepID=UPI0028173567|nr:NUDIX domain-containing protein [Candidatus Termitimicrobium sp.]MCL2431265.1 NUDIX domain-containing protein [Candidatus Termitimicrobium sp.]
MLQEKSCGAVIYSNKQEKTQYLLLNYTAGHWDFVKGNVEVNETEKQTVTREMMEETGITNAEFIEGFRESISYFYRRQGLTVSKEVIFYLIESQTQEIKLSFEHIGYIWANYQDAMEKLTFRNAKETLQKAHEYLQKKGLVKN